PPYMIPDRRFDSNLQEPLAPGDRVRRKHGGTDLAAPSPGRPRQRCCFARRRFEIPTDERKGGAMTAALRTTALGVVTERDQAERAVAELRSAGFRDDQIGVAIKKEEAPEEGPGLGETKATEGGVAGAVTGGVLGGVLGALAVSLIPGFGPVLAGGLLATVGA